MQKKIISFDAEAKFGFLKKNDVNEPIYFTYNCLHKPALLGVLGAIIGCKGYGANPLHVFPKGKKRGKYIEPEYIKRLDKVGVSILPLSVGYSVEKMVIKYNNSVGYANNGDNLIVSEQTLIKPKFRCFLLLDTGIEDHLTLFNRIKRVESYYIPYLGKNDFQLWWSKDSVKEYSFEEKPNYEEGGRILGLFSRLNDLNVKDSKLKEFSWTMTELSTPDYTYFENLPVGFNPELNTYDKKEFVVTNKKLTKEFLVYSEGLYYLNEVKMFVQFN